MIFVVTKDIFFKQGIPSFLTGGHTLCESFITFMDHATEFPDNENTIIYDDNFHFLLQMMFWDTRITLCKKSAFKRAGKIDGQRAQRATDAGKGGARLSSLEKKILYLIIFERYSPGQIAYVIGEQVKPVYVRIGRIAKKNGFMRNRDLICYVLGRMQ